MADIVEVSIKISREKLNRGCADPDSERVLSTVQKGLSKKEREKFLEPAAEFLSQVMWKEIFNSPER